MKSKPQSCYGCRLYDGRSSCMWFNPKKIIPLDILNRGCKLYDKKSNIEPSGIVKYIIDRFDGEII